jgi:hypothetical protein
MGGSALASRTELACRGAELDSLASGCEAGVGGLICSSGSVVRAVRGVEVVVRGRGVHRLGKRALHCIIVSMCIRRCMCML